LSIETTLRCALDILSEYRQRNKPDDCIERKPSPSDQDIAHAENALGASLPESYKLFLKQARECPLIFDEVFWVGSEGDKYRDIVKINEEEKNDESFQDFLIPFYADGYGNYFCFDTRENKASEYPIVFWDHEIQLDEPSDEDLEVVADNFAAWFLEEVEEQIRQDKECDL